jgi:F420-dependent oxidoreductase-like protein
VRLGVDVSQHQLTWPEFRDRALWAEEVGFDGVWVFDHFKALYGDPAGPCLEAWTLLAGLATITSRVRLGTLVTGITYRAPSILATEAVTVDHLSDGRLELAVGAAWHEREHHELGLEFPPASERIRRLDEAIRVMRLLMTEDGATFEGDRYRLNHAAYNPKPVQKPHPPLWIGGQGERLMLRLVAREADAWHGYGSVDTVARKCRLIDQYATEVGRDPKSILRSTALSISEPWDEVRAQVEALAGIGIGYLTVSWPSEGRARIEEFAHDLKEDIEAL